VQKSVNMLFIGSLATIVPVFVDLRFVCVFICQYKSLFYKAVGLPQKKKVQKGVVIGNLGLQVG